MARCRVKKAFVKLSEVEKGAHLGLKSKPAMVRVRVRVEVKVRVGVRARGHNLVSVHESVWPVFEGARRGAMLQREGGAAAGTRPRRHALRVAIVLCHS